jgi:hypothetical protein
MDAISVSVAQDLFEINAPSDLVVVLLEVHITQDASETSEQLPFQVHNASGTGSGGASVTPTPLHKGDAASTAVVERNNTTRSTEGTIFLRQSENILNGLHLVFTPESWIYISPSTHIVVGLEAAPGAALTMSGYCVIGEIGG